MFGSARRGVLLATVIRRARPVWGVGDEFVFLHRGALRLCVRKLRCAGGQTARATEV